MGKGRGRSELTKSIPWDTIDGLLRMDATIQYCAKEAGVSHDTLERECKRLHGITIAEYKRMQLDKTAVQIKQKMITKALSGDNTCMIFCLKNIGGWTDRMEHSVEDGSQKTLVLKYQVNKSKVTRVKDEEEAQKIIEGK